MGTGMKNQAINGLTNVVTTAGTTVLTALSPPIQRFTGTTTQTAQLPVTSTLHLGFPFEFINDSTGAVTVKSSGGNDVTVIGAGDRVRVRALDLAVTNASGWAVEYFQKASSITASSTNSWTNQQTFKETKDTSFTITDVASFEIDPANGNLQTVVCASARTPLATNFESGQSVLLRIKAAGTITWTSIGIVWLGGATPTLATTGYSLISIWKDSGTVYGSYLGDVAS